MANRIKCFETHIEIHCDRGDVSSQHLAGQIPYVHRNRINTLFKTSPRNIDLVLKLFRNLDADNIHTAPPSIQLLYEREMQRRSATESLIEHGPTIEHQFLWRHQRMGVELAHVNRKFGFFYDTRTGKTPMSWEIINQDIMANPHHKWLVLCPLILIENAWIPDGRAMFPHIKAVALWAKTQDKRLALFRENANVYIMNIESFVDYRRHLEKMNFHGCIVDESSTMKSNSSKFGQEAVDYAWTLKRWYLLSGTPAPNGEWEYYRQLQSIDFYGVHQSYSQFKQYFFDNTSRNPQYEKLRIKADRKEELLALLRKYSLYVDKEDVLKTPGRDFIEVELTLPDALKENYDQLKKELYLELGDNLVVTAPSTAASLNKLNQVTSGFIIDTAAMKHNRMLKEAKRQGIPLPPGTEEDKVESHFLSDYRFVELDKLLNQIGDKQVLIWCVYKKEFEILKERLGDKCACVYGDTGIVDKNANIKAFKEGKIQYLIANPASADKGLTLTNAHHAIYFSLGYSYELWKQSIERIYGDIIKQPNRCTYHIFIAKGTVDRVIYTAVQNKGSMSSEVLDHLKGGL